MSWFFFLDDDDDDGVYDSAGNSLGYNLDMDYCRRPPQPGQTGTVIGYDSKGRELWVKSGGDPGHETGEYLSFFAAIGGTLLALALWSILPWTLWGGIIKVVCAPVVVALWVWFKRSQFEEPDWSEWDIHTSDLWTGDGPPLTDEQLSQMDVAIGEDYGLGEGIFWYGGNR